MSDLPNKRSRPYGTSFSFGVLPVHGILFFFTGIILSVSGASMLYDLYKIALACLPLGTAEQTADRISNYWPSVFNFFVGFVATISACLFGCVWTFSGAFDVFKSRAKTNLVGSLNNPPFIISKLFPIDRIVSDGGAISRSKGVWPVGLTYSPISSMLVKSAFISLIKVCFVWGLLWILFFLIQVAPTMLQRFFSIQVSFTIPSLALIHYLFIVAICLNMALSILLITRRQMSSNVLSEDVVIKGNITPSFFLSVFENVFELLSPKGIKPGSSFKLRSGNLPGILASLVENHPKPVKGFGTPVGFLSAPLSVVSIVWGFSSLMALGLKSADPVTPKFISTIFPNLIIDVFFYIGMVWLGLYLAERIRILCSIRRYQSTVALCVVKPQLEVDGNQRSAQSESRSDSNWELVDGSGDELIAWAKAPNTIGTFNVRVLWAKIISESLEDSSSRYLFKSENDPNTDNLVRKVFELTHNIRFEKARVEETSSAGR